MAIEKRLSSFEAIRGAIKKAVDDYRSLRSPEVTGATTKTAIVQTGRFRLPKLRTLTTIDANDGSGIKLEVQTKRGERPDRETINSVREGMNLARSDAARKIVDTAKASFFDLRPQDRSRIRKEIQGSLDVDKAINLRQRVVLSKSPIYEAEAGPKSPSLSDGKTWYGPKREELTSDDPRTIGAARIGSDRVTMKVGPSIADDSESLSKAVNKALEERASRASLVNAVRSRTREGR